MNSERSWAYEDNEYWNKLRKSRDYYEEEHCTLDGNDGEDEFDQKILEAVKGKRVLDVGCGIGLFTLEIAKRANNVVGIDFSEEAIARSVKNKSGQGNVQFKKADAGDLPFSQGEFDVVLSRRGPATSTTKTIREAYRVLKTNGILMEITIGEKDKKNILEIFGRGQMYDVKERVAVLKNRMLTNAGFRVIEIKDYLATEIFASVNDLIIRLKSAPIIPNFDAKNDGAYLSKVEKMCKTSRGIETEDHRVTIIARK